MRGERAHKAIASTKNADGSKKTKGRNSKLLEARNACLLHRYYYYTKIHRLRYENILAALESEFFLSADTIPRIIDKHIAEVAQLNSAALTVRQLNSKFPFMKWLAGGDVSQIKTPVKEVYNRY